MRKEASFIYFPYCGTLILYDYSITTSVNLKCKLFSRSHNKVKFTSSLLANNLLWMKLTLWRDYIKASQLRVLLMNNSVCFKVILAVITPLNAAHDATKIIISIQAFI